MATSSAISDRIFKAALSGKLTPGSRLGEQDLAVLFDCSRTIVREALIQLAARGLVTVSARRGWYVAEPSREEAREAFEARMVIETGLIRSMRGASKPALRRLRAHIKQQQAALKSDDAGRRSFLLGDFHVCLAECSGNGLLSDVLRDLTARTTLAAMRYQSDRDAAHSCAEHVEIVEALETGEVARAEQLMIAHLSTWQVKLPIPAASGSLARLREALRPLGATASGLHPRHPPNAGRHQSVRSTQTGDVR